ncbi:Ig-like domain-containing protein [Agromyces sp. CCNWLW203]|uniref:Ig-like domain-containing protein n=1 Tax=Agromyces sp. CCNWLW203 TaxID=3112842 RepID=UPI002F96D7C8
MSTDARPADEPGASRASSFARRLGGSIAVLALAAGGFAFANVAQGPRLNDAQLDAKRTTVLAGQKLTLEVNQPVASIDEDGIVVEPEAAVTAEIDDRAITLTFDAPLDHSTDYTVSVPGVVGAVQPTPATLEYEFTTPGAELYTLNRRSDQGEPDAVQRRPLDGGDPEIVFEAPRIQEFAHAGDLLLAVTIEEDGSNLLFVSDMRQGEPQQFGIPRGATIRDLAVSTTNPLAALVLSSPEVDGVRDFDNELIAIDLSTNGGMELVPVLGLNGEKSRVSSWMFVPGTTSVVVQDFEQSVFVVDVIGKQQPSPLGVHTELRGFVPGTAQLIVADPDRGVRFDLTDGSATTLELASADIADHVYPGPITVLDGQSRYLISLVAATVEGDRNVRSSILAEVDDTGEMREVFAPADSASLIREYCVSPNGQYAAVTQSPEPGTIDGYRENPGFTDLMTTVVEIRAGRTVASSVGGHSEWCSN